MAETMAERKKREEREMVGERVSGSLIGTRAKKYEPDVTISVAKPEPGSTVLTGDKSGARAEKAPGMDDRSKTAAANNVKAIAAQKKRKWYDPRGWF